MMCLIERFPYSKVLNREDLLYITFKIMKVMKLDKKEIITITITRNA